MFETNWLRFAEKEVGTVSRAVDVIVPVDDNDVKEDRGSDGGEYSLEGNRSGVTCDDDRCGCRLECPEGLVL